VSRFKKLLIVVLILGSGVGLAWPFRKTGLETTNPLPDEGRQSDLEIALKSTDHKQPPTISPESENQARHVVAKMASFDLANHPAAINRAGNSAASPVTPNDRGSARQPEHLSPDQYLVMDGDQDTPIEVMHIVRNSDTLEKLAKRYLGDGGRALEIFDLNRDRLENPHLLPIGAELRIPVDPARLVE
jgi:nucleoid-associated protein YgaU